MVDETTQEEKVEGLGWQLEEEIALDKPVVRGGGVARNAPELGYDFQENYADEQRQNLYRKILKMSVPEKLRLAVLGNREARNLLIANPTKGIPLAVLRNPKITESEVLKYAQQNNLGGDVILAIAKHHKWIKNYQIKLAVVCNPQTPLSVAINLLSHIHEKDLKSISRDKAVSQVLRSAAHHTVLKRDIKH